MSAAFRKGKNLQLYVPTEAGGLVQRSTGTPDKQAARAMQRMVAMLRDTHRWPILNALRDRLTTLDAVYVAYVADPSLRAFEGELTTPDVVPLIPDFLRALEMRLGARASGSRFEYELAVRGFCGPSRKASTITPAAVLAWLATMEDAATGYRRAAFYRVRSFVRYLVDRGVLATNPLRDMRAPAKGKPRIRFETVQNDQAIVDAAPSLALAALFALVHATGADLSPALAMRRRDIDLEALTCHVPGTKSARRDRHGVTIEPWARQYLQEYLAAFLPAARPWDAFSRYTAAAQHRAACLAVSIEDYTLRDARHSIARRMILAGATLEDVARQLGSSVYTVGTVYTEFWHQTTTARAERAGRAAATPGAGGGA